jgi:hypothetical protein
MSDWRRCNDWNGSKVFSKRVPDGELLVIVDCQDVCEERPQWHLSISHRKPNLLNAHGGPLPGRIPSWEEIREARYRFVPDEVNMAMMLPPKRLYVNIHPTCMHLWEIPVRYASQDFAGAKGNVK